MVSSFSCNQLQSHTRTAFSCKSLPTFTLHTMSAIATASSSSGHMLLPTPRHHQQSPQSDHGSVHISIPKHLLQPAGCRTHSSMTTNKPPSRLSRKTAGTVKSRLLFVFRLCNFAFRLFAEKKNNPKPTHIQTKKEILLSSLQIILISVKAQLPKKSLFKSSSPPPAFGFFLVHNLLWILEAIDSS